MMLRVAWSDLSGVCAILEYSVLLVSLHDLWYDNSEEFEI
jgi:hypothetical protein